MATFTLISEQWQGGSVGMKMVVGTVEMNDAAAGGYVAGGEALNLTAYFATAVWGGIPIAMDDAAAGGCAFGMIPRAAPNARSPFIAAHRDPVDAGAAQSMLAEVTAGVDLSALVRNWVFFGV